MPYVVYCDTGRRSSAAAYILVERGFDAYVLKGGLTNGTLRYAVGLVQPSFAGRLSLRCGSAPGRLGASHRVSGFIA